MASQLLRTSLRALSRPAFKAAAYAAAPRAPITASRLAPMVARPIATRFYSSGTVDADLVHKLEEELQYEKANEESDQPEFVKEFLQANSFQLEDKLGHDEVSLTRSFGNEKIRILFSIADINNGGPADEFLAEGEEAEDDVAPSFPVRASITVEKDGKGAVTIDTVAQDGDMAIESVMFYKESRLANEQSAEADWQRRGLYIGPQFAELDENLQGLFARYLEERGVNAGLAAFLPDYVEYKEQKEYVHWLDSMKTFISA
ncbi:mitochondrial glycoprotein [Zychaea mexicana]|uniref:mitochondrial glycoprotein n=1 Tax=Zychaea mexicana TaxID=64656 RepID=UPI0022FEE3EB|nr:mitochondrial glycoprotein [Zychaea mexicana]KAI9499617.1 mitochondrial glycoprotein [Zychaea mexicana]